MASFKIPESPTFNYLDLNNLQGMDSWNTNPNIMRSSDMLNVVKKEGLHQVRHNIRQSYMVGKYGTVADGDDILYKIKYVGKIEEYDENGNTVPYYIKISEYLGEYQKENDSRICISVWPTPKVRNIFYDLSQEEGFNNYRIEYRTIPFTNFGQTGNRQGSYEHIQFDGKERVFTPIGILSFKCSTEEVITTVDDVEQTYYQLHFEIENVLDNPYVPTIIYGSTPDGLDYTRYEAINLLTNRRQAQFLSDGVSTVYRLPEKKVSSSHCIVKVLQENGTYTEMTTGFTLNSQEGTVTFNSAPARSPVDGKDNIIIEYSKPPTSSEDNTFNLSCVAGDNLLEANVNIDKSVDLDESDKLNITLTATFKKGSKFNPSKQEIKNGSYMYVFLSNRTVGLFALTNVDAATINNGGTVTKTINTTLDRNNLTSSTNWRCQLKVDYNNITSTETTIVVPGSVGGNTSIGTQRLTCLGFSWIGLQYSAWADAHVGSAQNGSDSYWNVYESVQLWVSKPSYLNCGAGNLYGIIDGATIYAGSTGNMYGTSTVYPANPVTTSRRINYSPGKNSVSIAAYMQFGTPVNLSGHTYTEMSAGTSTLALPSITLPHTSTTGTTTKTPASVSGANSYDETSDPSYKVSYDNVVPGSARLACYYGAKCVAVYGYESDRRVFVSDGTNKDTYSGVTTDGKSSIYYFPDDNYNVLGEDTEILGYAQKHGYLFTFKRGEDSVYVRYGTTQNNVTIFPSTVVTRNLQVLSRPIQINDEVLLITRDGIKSISYISNEVRAELRSYFINNYFELSADYNYDRMTWFVDDNLLHIFLDKYEFTCDLVTKSYVREGVGASGSSAATTLSFQYEWFVSEIDWLDNRQPPQVTTYQPKDFERQSEGIVYENQRAIGYSPEGIYEFFYNDYKVDVLLKIENEVLKTYYKPIKAHYITPFLNMNAINVAKTIKYVYINTRSKNGDMFAVGYIDENGVTETMQKEYTNIEDYRTKLKNSLIPFPKLVQIKSKIRKFMNVKLYIQNRAEVDNTTFIREQDVADYGNMTFDRILVQYQVAGKYRGE